MSRSKAWSAERREMRKAAARRRELLAKAAADRCFHQLRVKIDRDTVQRFSPNRSAVPLDVRLAQRRREGR